VDFNAEMRLQECPMPSEFADGMMTCIEWDLDLAVTLQFPQFIHKMSGEMIQKTGDGVLAFVVKRVSSYLTAKVQADFHTTHQIKVPKKLKLRK
jgi:hypothetical protein